MQRFLVLVLRFILLFCRVEPTLWTKKNPLTWTFIHHSIPCSSLAASLTVRSFCLQTTAICKETLSQQIPRVHEYSPSLFSLNNAACPLHSCELCEMRCDDITTPAWYLQLKAEV